MYPNRVVATVAAALSLTLAVLPVLADLDWTSTAGVIAGIGAVAAVTLKWLTGWQAHEARQTVLRPTPLPPTSEDEDGPGDPDSLPHFPAKDPARIEPDKGDAGPPETS